ncbi:MULTISPECIES: universal stress protein [unclassified Streptomyces]|uniref:universal stress protein n=1 Tax=unclassified Streptomyces TaxID=2593676 RepID=UPI000CD5C900|nr:MULTISPECIES: universal stress protein [unclassified Streptomyces]
MTRGTLRVYLGAAPGVGKTYGMLSDGRRRAGRGEDVVIGFVEDHGRAPTRRMAEGLETVPRRSVRYRGVELTEMDLDAVLARRPEVALVDELAHTNVPGCRHLKRWQDVEELLNAGIDVVSTVNIQHLESLNEVVRQITGVSQHETVPDEVVRRADQLELVDMSAQALRRRIAYGDVYPADRVEESLAHYFREGNLTALRELALLWVADRVEEALRRYRDEQGIDTLWATRERVVVALPGGPEGETLVRRAARIASRGAGGELMAVHVRRGDGLSEDGASMERQRQLVERLGGRYEELTADDAANAVLRFARQENATQIVIGASRRGRTRSLLSGKGIGTSIVKASGEHIDVYVVTHEAAAHGRL